MIEEIILGAQIATAPVCISGLLGLYRLLVSQKNATIEVLREKNGFLQEQLDNAKSESPIVAARSLANQVSL